MLPGSQGQPFSLSHPLHLLWSLAAGHPLSPTHSLQALPPWQLHLCAGTSPLPLLSTPTQTSIYQDG